MRSFAIAWTTSCDGAGERESYPGAVPNLRPAIVSRADLSVRPKETLGWTSDVQFVAVVRSFYWMPHLFTAAVPPAERSEVPRPDQTSCSRGQPSGSPRGTAPQGSPRLLYDSGKAEVQKLTGYRQQRLKSSTLSMLLIHTLYNIAREMVHKEVICEKTHRVTNYYSGASTRWRRGALEVHGAGCERQHRRGRQAPGTLCVSSE